MKKPRNYDVGHGKPPKDTRFQKGKSGNPLGRPKGNRSVLTVAESTWNERVPVTENGARKRISKLEAIFKQVVNKAASGDLQAIKQVMQLVLHMKGKELAEAAKQPLPWNDDDGAVEPEI